jgi:hypothetical protein
MRIPRRFTEAGTSPYDYFTYERRSSVLRNPDGTIVFEMHNIEVPAHWSQIATDILAQKYFRKAGVPQYDEQGNPVLDAEGKPVLGPERSIKQVVHRLVGCWRHWGETHGYFDTPEDAQAFYDELVYMILAQMAAPNSPQWFNTGLAYAYGITGNPKGIGTWTLPPGVSSAPRMPTPARSRMPASSSPSRTTWSTRAGSSTCSPVRRASSSTAPARVRTSPRCALPENRSPAEESPPG